MDLAVEGRRRFFFCGGSSRDESVFGTPNSFFQVDPIYGICTMCFFLPKTTIFFRMDQRFTGSARNAVRTLYMQTYNAT